MKKVISTSNAPAAIGPYSQAVSANGFVFLSGQIPLRADGTLNDGDITEQTVQVMTNLEAVLQEAGCTFDSVVMTTIYLADMNDFSAVNEVYGSYFESSPPARATVEVGRLPKDSKVEISVVAAV